MMIDNRVAQRSLRSSRVLGFVMVTGLAVAAFSGVAQAQLVSQIANVGGICGGDALGANQTFGNCTAGEISLATVTDIVFEGGAITECVAGQPLNISSATVNYSLNTNERSDLLMWIGDQEGTDPRLNSNLPTQSCSAFSLPGPFNPVPPGPTLANPFGNIPGDDDQCADVAISVTSASRTFTNLTFQCQDNDEDGKADAQILLTWIQNEGTACGTGPGQTFPVVGPKSKCDYELLNTTLDIVFPPTLTLVKQVTNNDGGTAVASNWTLTASGPDSLSGTTGSPAVTDQVVDQGTYTLGETGPGGYLGTWNCTGTGDFTFTAPDQLELNNTTGADPQTDVTCTLVNDDQPATLTLVKQVVNDNGGTALPTAWTLSATGPTVISGAGGVGPSPVDAGVYVLAETSVSGYSAGAWQCTDGTLVGNQLTLALGDVAVCTIVNNDIAATLTLAKTVTNDDGGTAAPDDWTLTADGTTDYAGTTSGFWQGGVSVNADTYTLLESGPGGYTAGTWQCNGGTLIGNQLTLALGQSASCTIANNDQPATLTLVKSVTNDNGGNAVADDWTLTADGTNDYAFNTTGWAGGRSVEADTYALSESNVAGYTAGSWSCQGGTQNGSSITLALGESAVCTIVNDDQAPSLTLVKSVTNDDGGSLTPGDFTLTLGGADGIHTPPQNYTSGATPTVLANVTYTLSELPEDGYINEGVTCVNNGDQSPVGHPVTLNEGQSVTCTISNNDVAQGTITVVKNVTNDDGGQLAAADFDILITATGTDCSVPVGTVKSGYTIDPATDGCAYTVSEPTVPNGYTLDSVVCTEQGGEQPVGIPPPGTSDAFLFTGGETWTCVVSNNDDAASLTLNKVVVNNDGGTAAVGDFTLRADSTVFTSGQAQDVDAGTYTLSETGPDGYSASIWSCQGGSLQGDQLTLALGDSASCTITNDDVPASLTLTKLVTNDDGGTSVAADWTLSYGAVSFSSGQTQDVSAGTFTLGESGPDGYQAGSWQCTGDGTLQGDQLTLALGETASCQITNNDIAPALTLVKSVTNDDGGAATADGFTLTLFGADGVHDPALPYGNNATPTVVAGVSYTVDEQLIDGYDNEGVVCIDTAAENEPVAHPVTLSLGQAVTCTLTNNDIAPTLTLVKDLTNDDGGTLSEADFVLNLTGADLSLGGVHEDGEDYADGDTPTIFAGVEYVVSEDTVPENYELTGIVCMDLDAQTEIVNPFTPTLGQNVECTVSNDDVPPTLTLVKEVINDDGGDRLPEGFAITLTGDDDTHASGVDYVDGDTPDIRGEVEYTVTEVPPNDYELVSIICRDVSGADLGSSFTAVSGDDITCTVTNDDILQNAYFTVIKDFSDNNPAEVEVRLTCNTGLPLQQTFLVSETESVKFVIRAFEPGTMDCRIEEISDPTDGYDTLYEAGAIDGEAADERSEPDGCYYDAVEGGEFICEIDNILEPVDLTVFKEWLDVGDGDGVSLLAKADYSCYNVRSDPFGGTAIRDGGMVFNGVNDSSVVTGLYPDYDLSSYCVVEETKLASAAESDDSECANLPIAPGQGASCTIYNTVFFEGIPTLNQYGMAILALLMLGIGAIGFRRFS